MIHLDQMRYAEYTGMPRVIGPVAAGLGIELSDDALRSQTAFAGMVAVLNDTLDKGTPAEGRAALDYWEHLACGTAFATRQEELLLPQLTQDMQLLHELVSPTTAHALHSMGKQAVSLSKQYAGEQNIFEYHKLRSQEANLALRMLALAVPDQDAEHIDFEYYVYLSGTIGVAIGAMDSVKDLRADAEKGKTAIRPTPRAYAALSRLAFHETAVTLRALGSRTTIGVARATFRLGYEVEKLHYLEGVRHTN